MASLCDTHFDKKEIDGVRHGRGTERQTTKGERMDLACVGNESRLETWNQTHEDVCVLSSLSSEEHSNRCSPFYSSCF